LQGSALRENINVAQSRENQAQLEYEQAILRALEDVESALINYGKEWQTLEQLKKAGENRQESFNIAKFRYEEGVENFLIVLDAERTLISNKQQIIESETNILTKLTQLYKALGGGWGVSEKTTDKHL
jgi:multidrug efflux system outer membrane protein